MKTMFTKVFALCAAAAATFALAACSPNSTESDAVADGKLQVVASTTQLQDFAAQIGGDKVEITGLLKPGASAHSFDPSPSDLKALADADLLLVNGAGLDGFIETAAEAAGFQGKLITAADGVDLNLAAEISHEAAVAAGQVAGETEDEHDHGSAEYDPHIWSSLVFAKQMLNPVATAFATADPDNSEFYHENTAAYAEKLDAAHEWLTAQFAQVPAANKKFVSTHNALLYFLHDYDIAFVGSVIPSFEDNAEPSAAEINQLVANIKEQQVPAVFFESSSSERLNQTVAKEAGVPVVTAPIYADSLAAEGSGSTYLGATLENARTMLTAWGQTAGEIPSELQ